MIDDRVACRRLRRWAAACFAAFASSIHPTVAVAEDASVPIVLMWSAPAGCPSSADVLDRVRARLAEDGPTTTSVVSAHAEITPARSGRPWRLELSLANDDGTGARLLEAPTCAELADATALILAMSLRPDAAAGNGAPGGEATLLDAPRPFRQGRELLGYAHQDLVDWQVEVSAPTPRVDSILPEKRDKSARKRRGVDLWVGGAVQSDIGTLPLPSAAGMALVGVRVLDVVRMEAAGTYWAEQRVEEARLSLLTGSLSACPTRWILDSLELAVCGAAELGQLSFDPGPLRLEGERDELWAALRTGAGLTWFGVEWGGLFARTDVSVPLVHPSFDVGDHRYSEAPELAAARGFVGAEVRIR